MQNTTFELRKSVCPLCGNKAQGFSINSSNLQFLESRAKENNLDQALNICASAWSVFPELRNRSDTRNIVDTLIEHIQQQFTKALVPLETIAKMTTPLNLKIEQLTERLPGDLKDEFLETNNLLIKELASIQETTKQFAEPIQKEVRELSQSIAALVNKPSLKGSVNEQTLQIGWQETFLKDKIIHIGGAGKPDLVVTPFLELGSSRYGSKIIVERKAGSQKYSGTHFAEAISHTKAEGGKYCVIVYDAADNLLAHQKPVCFSFSDGITLAVSDIQTGGWRCCRQVIEVLQVTLPDENAGAEQAIDIKKLQAAIQQIASLNSQIELLRKNNNSAIISCERARGSINRLEELVFCHQQNLHNLLLEKPSLSNKVIN
jgi:hypothetical protein